MRLFNPAGIVNPNLTLHCTALRYTNYNYSYNYNYATLHYTTVHQTTLHYATLHYITLRSLNYHKCNCNYTALIILHHNDNSTTLQLQLQLCYTPLHPAVVGEVTDQVTTATIATTPKNNSNHLSVHQWIRSAIRVSQQSTSPIGFLFLKLPPLPCAALLVKNGPKWYRETSKHISSVGQVNHGESGGKNWKLCTEARPGKAQSDPEPHGLLSEFVSGECHQQYIAGKI